GRFSDSAWDSSSVCLVSSSARRRACACCSACCCRMTSALASAVRRSWSMCSVRCSASFSPSRQPLTSMPTLNAASRATPSTACLGLITSHLLGQQIRQYLGQLQLPALVLRHVIGIADEEQLNDDAATRRDERQAGVLATALAFRATVRDAQGVADGAA